MARADAERKGLLRNSKCARLKVILMSATVDAGFFVKYFSTDNGKDSGVSAGVVGIEGRTYPVQIRYWQDCETASYNKELVFRDDLGEGYFLDIK